MPGPGWAHKFERVVGRRARGACNFRVGCRAVGCPARSRSRQGPTRGDRMPSGPVEGRCRAENKRRPKVGRPSLTTETVPPTSTRYGSSEASQRLNKSRCPPQTFAAQW